MVNSTKCGFKLISKYLCFYYRYIFLFFNWIAITEYITFCKINVFIYLNYLYIVDNERASTMWTRFSVSCYYGPFCVCSSFWQAFNENLTVQKKLNGKLKKNQLKMFLRVVGEETWATNDRPTTIEYFRQNLKKIGLDWRIVKRL